MHSTLRLFSIFHQAPFHRRSQVPLQRSSAFLRALLWEHLEAALESEAQLPHLLRLAGSRSPGWTASLHLYLTSRCEASSFVPFTPLQRPCLSSFSLRLSPPPPWLCPSRTPSASYKKTASSPLSGPARVASVPLDALAEAETRRVC